MTQTNDTSAITMLSRTVIRLLLAGIAMVTTINASADIAVVVNAGNDFSGTTAEKREIAAQLFLGQRSQWPSGTPSKPILRTSETHSAMLTEVLGMSRGDWAEHWVRQKQQSGETPPREVGRAGMAQRFVARDPGGITVVSETEAGQLDDGVKILVTLGD